MVISKYNKDNMRIVIMKKAILGIALFLFASVSFAEVKSEDLSYIFTQPADHLVVFQNAEKTVKVSVDRLCDLSKGIELPRKAQVTHVLNNEGNYIRCK